MTLQRRCLLLAAIGGLAAGRLAAATRTESRRVAGFDEIVYALAGELHVEIGPAESLTLEAEPAVLEKITAEVQGRRLTLAFAPGRIETREPIRARLQVRALRGLESRTAGTITVGPVEGESMRLALAGGGSIRLDRLAAQSLDVRIAGAGRVEVGGGRVATQRVTIAGIGEVETAAMAGDQADVAIDGSGEVHLAAAERLDVRIGGVGTVRYRGEPRITRSIGGVGRIEKD